MMAISFIPRALFDVDKASYVQWNEIVDTKCKGYPATKRFEYESYTCILCLSAMIPAYWGIAYEYYYTFEGDVTKWMRYNFDSDDNDNMDMSLIVNDEEGCYNCYTRWNRTSESVVNIKRLCVIVISSSVLMIPHVLISYESSYYVVIVFKVLCPVYAVTFFMFSYMKTLCRVCCCANGRLFAQERREVV